MRGPAGVAFLAWRRVRGWKKRQDDMLDRYPDTGELPPGMAPELVDVGRIPVQLRVRSVLDLAATDHRRRILVHRWMGDPAEQVRRFLYWAHRALGQSRQPKLLALAVSTSTSHLKPLFFSELATLPDYLHVEGGPGGLAKQVMQAAAHRQMAEIRRDLALPWRVFAERRVARLPRALERDSGSGAFGPDLRRRAVQELIQAHLELEQNEAALEVHRFHAALADAGPGRYHLAAVVRRLGPVWEKLPEAPATRAVIPAVLTGLEAIEAEGFRPGDDGLWAEAGRIRARFGK